MRARRRWLILALFHGPALARDSRSRGLALRAFNLMRGGRNGSFARFCARGDKPVAKWLLGSLSCRPSRSPGWIRMAASAE